MHRLIWVFAGRICHFVGFVMRWLKRVSFTVRLQLTKHSLRKKNVLMNLLHFLLLVCGTPHLAWEPIPKHAKLKDYIHQLMSPCVCWVCVWGGGGRGGVGWWDVWGFFWGGRGMFCMYVCMHLYKSVFIALYWTCESVRGQLAAMRINLKSWTLRILW